MRSFETILALLVASTALSVVARRLRMPVPIVMVLGGLAVALIPRHRIVEIDPDLAFTMFVPPILFGSALSTSTRYLKANLRVVLSLAVGLILATTLAVAPLARAYAHRLGWHGAFVLGAVVAPSDAVVTLAIAHALRLSPRAVNVLEGETLFNDATAFVVYGVAVHAATTGELDWRTALPRFLLVAAGGVVVGWIVYRVVSFVGRRLEDTVLESVILLLTPFVAYLPAEALHVSGVLAVVVAGMLLRRSAPLLVSARTRLHGNAVRSLVEFILNSLVFILIGMQLGAILRDPVAPALGEVLRTTAIVGGVVMAVRIVWVFSTTYMPWLSRRVRSRERAPSARNVAIIAWTGTRGGDSLVMALAVPQFTALGAPLLGRDLILATSFGVILLTLLAQGLTLGPLVRLVHPPPDRSYAEEVALARRRMSEAGDGLLDKRQRDGEVPREIIDRIRRIHQERRERELDQTVDDAGRRLGILERKLERELLQARRSAVVELRRARAIDDAVVRDIERELDLEEVRLAYDDV